MDLGSKVVICSYGICGGWWMGQLGNGFALLLCYNTVALRTLLFFFSLFLSIWLLRKWWKRKKRFVGSNLVMGGAW